MPANARIIRDSFDPAKKDRDIAWSGDRDLGSNELRRGTFITDQKLAALSGSLYPEGFIPGGLVPLVRSVTNLLPWSNRFDMWSVVNGAIVTPNAASDRYGALAASRLTGLVGQDSYIELAAGPASGSDVFAIDAKIDATPALKVSYYDGVTEIATHTFTLTNTWQRFELPNAVWSPSATTLRIRLRPGPGSQPASIFIARSQLEPIAAGHPIVAGQYVETTGTSASGPGNTVDFGAGVAQVHGLPRAFAAQTVVFDPLVSSGLATAYGEYAERYLTGFYNRPELDNPTTGNVGQDAVREETQIVLSDTTDPAPAMDLTPTNPQYRSRTAVPIFQFDRATGLITPVVGTSLVDLSKTVGDLPGSRVAPQSIPEDRIDLAASEGQGGLLAALARRLFDQSGNFVVTRTQDKPSIVQDLTDVSQIAMTVNPLDGFTGGKSFYLDRPKPLVTPLQTTTATRQNEQHTYYLSTDTYPLSKPPVVSVQSLIGIFRVTRTITRGPVLGGKDNLPDTPVFQILSVTQGVTTFNVNQTGGDCFQDGDAINWSPSGSPSASEPAPGSTYTVEYLFDRVWPAGEFTFTSTTITFTGANRPEPTLPFTVNYTYGQDRVDLIYLQGNQLVITQGTPSDHPTPPAVPDGAMELWDVVVGYQATTAQFQPRFTPGFPMATLADMARQIADIQYDLAQVLANLALRDRQTSLKGVLVDPWSDYRQFDLQNPYFNTHLRAVIDTARGRLVMAEATTNQRMVVDTAIAHTTLVTRGASWAGLAAAAAVLFTQNAYTTTLAANPAGNLGALPPTIVLSTQPWNVTPWVDAATVEVTMRGFGAAANETNIPMTVDGVAAGTANADPEGFFTFTTSGQYHRNSVFAAHSSRGVASAVLSLPTQWAGFGGLAQTFNAPRGGDLLSLDVYAASKSLSAPLVAMITPVGVGQPTNDILAMVALAPGAVATGGAPTTITFVEPVTLAPGVAYALVLASSDGAYTFHVATQGQTDHVGGGIVVNPPYGGGDVWARTSTSGGWQRQSASGLRMVVRTNQYQASGQLQTNDANFVGGITSFSLLAAYNVAANANLVWKYSIDPPATADGNRVWIPFDPTAGRIDLGAIANQIRFQVTATATGMPGTSGVRVNVENLILLANLAAFKSTYISFVTVLAQPTSTVKAYVQSYNKTGADAKPFASVDGGATWVTGTANGVRQLTPTLAEYEFDFTFGTPGTQFAGRVDLETGTPTLLPEGEQVAWVIQ